MLVAGGRGGELAECHINARPKPLIRGKPVLGNNLYFQLLVELLLVGLEVEESSDGKPGVGAKISDNLVHFCTRRLLSMELVNKKNLFHNGKAETVWDADI